MLYNHALLAVVSSWLPQDQILFDAAASLDAEQGPLPAAHRGFSSRARAIPIEALYHQAQAQGKRLVLCGGSWGSGIWSSRGSMGREVGRGRTRVTPALWLSMCHCCWVLAAWLCSLMQVPCVCLLPLLAGHSLGGAVAQLCAIRLLQQLPPSAHDNVSCIGFATPPVANQALADMASSNGWDRRLRNYLLPGGKGGQRDGTAVQV